MSKLHFPTNVEINDEVAGKWFPYGAGVDCHRDMEWACVLRPVYDTGKQKRDLCKFASDPSGLAEMRVWLEERIPKPHRRVLVESTSTYHFPVVRALEGWTPIVINPKLVGSAKRKTDRWDAQTLAHHCMAGTFPAYVLPTDAEHAMRVAYRRWIKIGFSIVRMTNALKSRMCLFGINYAFSTRSNVGFQVFRSMCLGRVPPRELVRNRRHWAATEFDGMVSRLPLRVVEVNALQLDGIDALNLERAKVFEVVRRCAPADALGRLLSVPFIKEPSACCFLAEVGFEPLRRFNSIKAIVAFAGFDPSKRVSADNVTSHLPCAGSRFLRKCFSQVAAGAMMSSHPLARLGAAVAARTGKRGWFAGRNAVGRKLIRWCSAVHVSGRPFTEGNRHGKDEVAGIDADAEWGAEWPIGGDLLFDERIAPPPGWDSPGQEEAQWIWGEGPLGDVEG